MKLKKKKAIVTGANQGLGYAIALAFIQEGADVAFCARDSEKLERAKEALVKASVAGQKVVAYKADVSDSGQVAQFVSAANERLNGIDILVNNAGIYGPKGVLHEVGSKEWIDAININLLGVFFMCKEVIPIMLKQGKGKIINLSGGGATAPLPRISSYAASKAAVVRLTETIAEEYRDRAIDVNAIAPGALNTRLLEEVLASGPDTVGKAFYDKALEQKKAGGAPLEKGAALSVFLASEESDGITGKLISAVWDPWEKLSANKEILKTSDIYCLRRILPEDRGVKFSL